jgi:hypothetical protein
VRRMFLLLGLRLEMWRAVMQHAYTNNPRRQANFVMTVLLQYPALCCNANLHSYVRNAPHVASNTYCCYALWRRAGALCGMGIKLTNTLVRNLPGC